MRVYEIFVFSMTENNDPYTQTSDILVYFTSHSVSVVVTWQNRAR